MSQLQPIQRLSILHLLSALALALALACSPPPSLTSPAPERSLPLAARHPKSSPTRRRLEQNLSAAPASRHNARFHDAAVPGGSPIEPARVNCPARRPARGHMFCVGCCHARHTGPSPTTLADPHPYRRTPALAALARYYASKCEHPAAPATAASPPANPLLLQPTRPTASSACPPSRPP